MTTLLDRAVTLATESANGTLSTTQRTSIDNEFTAIKAEIDSIGTATTYNGASVFTATATSIFMSDGSSTAANVTIATTTGLLSSAAIGTTGPVDLDSTDLTSAADATTALASITSAIANVASMRGTIGANMNRLTAAASVMQNEVTNYTSAESTISSADIGKAVSNLSQYQILQQTGMAALAQANSSQQAILKLLQ